MIFYRSNFVHLLITLNSDEPLGVLDTGFIEDFNGDDSQISVYNIATFERFVVVMAHDNGELTGSKLLSELVDGDYQIQGRVRDLVGNYTILGSYFAPIGNETVINLNFSIELGAFIPRPYGLYKVEARQATRKVESRKSVYRI